MGDEVISVKKKAQELQDLGIPSSAIRNRLSALNLVWNKAQTQIAELKNIRRISSSHSDIRAPCEEEGSTARIKYSTPQRLDSAYSSPTSSLTEYREKVNNLREMLSQLQRMLAEENFTEFGVTQQELLQVSVFPSRDSDESHFICMSIFPSNCVPASILQKLTSHVNGSVAVCGCCGCSEFEVVIEITEDFNAKSSILPIALCFIFILPTDYQRVH